MMNPKTLPDATAFPESHPNTHMPESGLTKREYFAAMALQGMLANGAYDPMLEPWGLEEKAVECADILIDALNGE